MVFNSDDRPVAMKVKMVSGNGTVTAEASNTFNLPSYWHQNFNGTPALDSIEFSMGDYGVQQVKIEF
jgi:hypothetical protein